AQQIAISKLQEVRGIYNSCPRPRPVAAATRVRVYSRSRFVIMWRLVNPLLPALRGERAGGGGNGRRRAPSPNPLPLGRRGDRSGVEGENGITRSSGNAH